MIEPEERKNSKRSDANAALKYDEDAEVWTAVRASRIRPGDVIVLPANRGGCDKWGWSPHSEVEVVDLGDQAYETQRGRIVLRVTRGTLANALLFENRRQDAPTLWSAVSEALAEDESLAVRLLRIHGLPERWLTSLRWLAEQAFDSQWYDDNEIGAGVVLYSKCPLPTVKEITTEDAITERTDSSYIGQDIGLEDHCQAVGKSAAEDARRAGLSDANIDVLRLSGFVHDLGKADPRFQAQLYGSSLVASQDLPLLAKSRRPCDFSAQSRRFVPKGFRHEALSVSIASHHPAVAELSTEDRILLLWLVGTHHGYGRPFFPACDDRAPGTKTRIPLRGVVAEIQAQEAPIRVDQGWFEHSVEVQRRWNPWELARLEAILRLADHRVSASESKVSRNGR